MKKSILPIIGIALLTSMQLAAFTTPGNKSAFTFQALSADPASGVSKVGNTYEVMNDLTIAATDTLRLDDGVTVALAANVALSIEGVAIFEPATGSTVKALDDAHPSRSISIESGAQACFRNVTMNGVGIATYADSGITIDACEIKNVKQTVSSTGALAINVSGKANVVKNSTFANCEMPAIGIPANYFCELTVEGCTFDDCNTSNTNKPMLNLTTPGTTGPMIICGNTFKGAKRNMVGGLSVANFFGEPGVGHVIIEGNDIRDCRYGINCLGALIAEIRDNQVIDNRYESNPMNGGSGISVTDNSGLLDVVMSGNRIERNIWGITLIGYGAGFKRVSLGEPANTEIDSPGGNVFKDNGTDGKKFDPTVPYDLYNNSPYTVYALSNTWSVDAQTPDQIEKVIFHKADNPSLGEVIYYDSNTTAALTITDDSVLSVTVYDLQGRKLADATNRSALDTLPAGSYILHTLTPSGPKIQKVAVR